MLTSDFISEPSWDAAFFKRLSHNDSGQAVGHQGGVVIPIPLRQFFPVLAATATAASPTADTFITADLYEGVTFLGQVRTRYQVQTWGGERKAESRLTDNLGALRNRSSGNDFLLFQRHALALDHYRLVLVRPTDPYYSVLLASAGTSRWGPVDPVSLPVTDAALSEAETEEEVREANPFSMFDAASRLVETTQKKLARSAAFRIQVQSVYGMACCICGPTLRTPSGLSNFEAAHIVPRNLTGADDIRNGLGLCRSHHWAFDKGLWGITTSSEVIVASSARAIVENGSLAAAHGHPVPIPADPRYQPHPAALKWHRDNTLLP